MSMYNRFLREVASAGLPAEPGPRSGANRACSSRLSAEGRSLLQARMTLGCSIISRTRPSNLDRRQGFPKTRRR